MCCLRRLVFVSVDFTRLCSISGNSSLQMWPRSTATIFCPLNESLLETLQWSRWCWTDSWCVTGQFYATGLNLQAAEWFSKRLKRKPAVCLDTWLHWMSKTVVTGLTCMSVPSNKSKKVGWLLTQKWVAVIASVWWRHVMFSTELDCRLLLETQERRRRTSKHAAGVHPIINITKAK